MSRACNRFSFDGGGSEYFHAAHVRKLPSCFAPVGNKTGPDCGSRQFFGKSPVRVGCDPDAADFSSSDQFQRPVAAGLHGSRFVHSVLLFFCGVRAFPEMLVHIHLRVAVHLHAGPGGDQLTDDHVLLQTEQRIALSFDGGVGEDLRRFL